MINSKKIIYIISFLVLVFLVYFTENQVDSLRKEIKKTNYKMSSYEEEIQILEAEWSYQNNPERLKNLVMRLSSEVVMQSPKYFQFTDLKNLPETNIYFSTNTNSPSLR
ncbi:MAG: hypothetical protein SFT90_00630 [Rickettsiales bacterium]|nr:hypothetical protein [Rickettsiales bacterium]